MYPSPYDAVVQQTVTQSTAPSGGAWLWVHPHSLCGLVLPLSAGAVPACPTSYASPPPSLQLPDLRTQRLHSYSVASVCISTLALDPGLHSMNAASAVQVQVVVSAESPQSLLLSEATFAQLGWY